MSNNINISVLMPTYKRSKILEKTLKSFCDVDFPQGEWEIVLVDNASDQMTRDLAESFAGRLPLRYYVERKQGKNNALNTALSHASGELYFFTDDDVIVDKRCLLEIWEGAQRWPRHSIFGGKVLPLWPEAGSGIRRMKYNYLKTSFALNEHDDEKPCDVKQIYGPNAAVRRNIFDQGIRYDPDVGPRGREYVMGGETEMFLRLERLGHKSVFLPKAVVRHQIRPEQLARKWLMGRAFKSGRAVAHFGGRPEASYMFGAPRYLYRLFTVYWIRSLYYTVVFNRTEALNQGFQAAIFLGQIYQHRKTSGRS